MTYYLHAGKFFLPRQVVNDGYLTITDDGRFGDYHPNDWQPTGKVVDYGNNWIAPGLVDTHIHGLLGHDVMDNDLVGLQAMAQGLLKAGVTSWLPTTLTASFAQINAVCQLIAQHRADLAGAKVQGIHLEGPYFTAEHKGAQDPQYLRDPDWDEFQQWQTSAHGLIKKIAIAPERHHAVAFTKQAVASGVTVALGHSSATYEQAMACVNAGASVFTHTFNGMPEFAHRQPGMVGAALSTALVDDEIICDGHHNAPAAVQVLINAKTPEHVMLVTDCMRAGMMPDGDYLLGELPVYVKDGMARLKHGNNLAGSILQLKDAVKNVVKWNLVTPQDAIMMASYVPAKSVKITDKCGMILPGRAADFIVLQPDMSLIVTYLDGVLRYQA